MSQHKGKRWIAKQDFILIQHENQEGIRNLKKWMF